MSDSKDNELPNVLVDTREQRLLVFPTLPSRSAGLVTGDYLAEALEHVVAVERKSVPDLTGSLSSGRERFERELHRLRGFDVPRLLIVDEGPGQRLAPRHHTRPLPRPHGARRLVRQPRPARNPLPYPRCLR